MSKTKTNGTATASLADWLRSVGVCGDAREWCDGRTPAEAWAECERGDWLLWIMGRCSGGRESESRRATVLAACACARLALPYVQEGETRPLAAIETAERWARGEGGATLADVRAAADAANAASAAAYAAVAAAAAACTAYAAVAAADAADAAAAAAYAAGAAKAEMRRRCADAVRAMHPEPPAWVVAAAEGGAQ